MSGSSWLLVAGLAHAHPQAPVGLVVSEDRGGWTVLWTQPAGQVGPGGVDLGPSCVPAAARSWTLKEAVPESVDWVQEWTCEGAGAPADLTVVGVADGPAVVTWRGGGGERRVLVSLRAGEPVPVDRGESEITLVVRYGVAGVAHVLSGLDHVLIMAGLVVAALGRSQSHRLPRAVLGFTLGHACTLVLVALGWWVVPVALTEGAIALTLVALGLRVWRRTATASPWGFAAIGLLHGLGFGAGLRALGLPLDHRVTALLGFNAGVEVAQVVVVAAVGLAWWGWPRRRANVGWLADGVAVVLVSTGWAGLLASAWCVVG